MVFVILLKKFNLFIRCYFHQWHESRPRLLTCWLKDTTSLLSTFYLGNLELKNQIHNNYENSTSTYFPVNDLTKQQI